MRHIILSLILLLLIAPISAQQWSPEHVDALTDKECYLAGERLCVRVDVTMPDGTASPSRVAYVEIADTRQLHAQAMVNLTDGQGWAEIALPATMHSGCYQLTAYTRAMRNFGTDTFFTSLIGVINGEQLSRRDDILFLPYSPDSIHGQLSYDLLTANVYAPGADIILQLPTTSAAGDLAVTVEASPLICNVQNSGMNENENVVNPPQANNLSTPSNSQTTLNTQLSTLDSKLSALNYTPELEGHLVRAVTSLQLSDNDTLPLIRQSRLALVGKMASLYDGQRQPDGSFLYYTNGIYGKLPTLVNAYDYSGRAVPMQLVSPYMQVLPKSLPTLQVYCQEQTLAARASAARRQAAATRWLGTDSLAHSTGFMSQEPRRFYDLDEYTQMSTIREVLLEFVKGVQRRKETGVSMLFTQMEETSQYSTWPALVLLDGMPVYDIDEILDYDAHLVKYVQIYSGRFNFGNSCCQGVISFITRGGRLSNYKLDSGSHLMSYAFPQDHPAYQRQIPLEQGTLLWQPSVRTPQLTFPAPAAPGHYLINVQGRTPEGTPLKLYTEFDVR